MKSNWRKVLAWEQAQEPEFEAIKGLHGPERSRAINELLAEIVRLQEANDPSVKRYRIDWYGSAYGTSYVEARSDDEAIFLQEQGLDHGFEGEMSDSGWEVGRMENEDTGETIYEN